MYKSSLTKLFTDSFMEYLGRYNMSFKDLAEKSGVSYHTVQQSLTGNRIPRLEVIVKMVHAFPEEGGRALLHKLFSLDN
jgi:transcriptional regulator with XRE-family HTH domain